MEALPVSLLATSTNSSLELLAVVCCKNTMNVDTNTEEISVMILQVYFLGLLYTLLKQNIPESHFVNVPTS